MSLRKRSLVRAIATFVQDAWMYYNSQAPSYKTFFMLNSLKHEISTAHTNKILTNKEMTCFKSVTCCIYNANNCYNANKCWHFNIYEQDNIRAQLS